jgi:hypothetical protein
MEPKCLLVSHGRDDVCNQPCTRDSRNGAFVLFGKLFRPVFEGCGEEVKLTPEARVIQDLEQRADRLTLSVLVSGKRWIVDHVAPDHFFQQLDPRKDGAAAFKGLPASTVTLPQ